MAKIVSSTMNESKDPFQLDFKKYKTFLISKKFVIQFENKRKNKANKTNNALNELNNSEWHIAEVGFSGNWQTLGHSVKHLTSGTALVHISFSFCQASKRYSPYSVILHCAVRQTNSVIKALPLVSETFPLSFTSQFSTSQPGCR